MKKIAFFIFLTIVGAFITIYWINGGDAGTVDEVSLQVSEGVFSAADLHPQCVYVEYSTPPSYTRLTKSDDASLKANTFVMKYVEEEPEEEVIEEFIPEEITMWVDVKCANVRVEATTDSDIYTQLYKGTEILCTQYNDEWSTVLFEDGTVGYMMSSLLSTEPVEEEPEPTPIPEPSVTPIPTATPVPEVTATPVPSISYSETSYNVVMYATSDLNVRSGPDVSASLVKVLGRGDRIDVVAYTDNGWYKTINGNFVKRDYCTEEEPVITQQPTTDSNTNDSNSNATSNSSTGNGFADYCMQFLGTSYVYAGSSPSGFDCSGLVMYVYANYYGISLPHSADEISRMGYGVTSDSIQVGDILCHDYNSDGYIDHVSMYIGNSTCIHASDSRHGVITSSYPMGSVITIRRVL